MPFCKCPSYRSAWEDYWYMGPKCDQLWSTLDLILVAAVPTIALALAAAVIMQWVGYCGSRPRYGPGEGRAHARRPKPEVLYNPVAVPKLNDNSRNISQQKGHEDDGGVRYTRFPRLPVQSHAYEQPPLPGLPVGALSYNRQPAVPVERGPLVNQHDPWQNKIPDADYDDVNPFSAIPMQQFPRAVPSLYPRFD